LSCLEASLYTNSIITKLRVVAFCQKCLAERALEGIGKLYLEIKQRELQEKSEEGEEEEEGVLRPSSSSITFDINYESPKLMSWWAEVLEASVPFKPTI
jgi:hypothetical protein